MIASAMLDMMLGVVVWLVKLFPPVTQTLDWLPEAVKFAGVVMELDTAFPVRETFGAFVLISVVYMTMSGVSLLRKVYGMIPFIQ